MIPTSPDARSPGQAGEASSGRCPAPPRQWLWRTLFTATILVALGLGGAISLSKPFQNGATRIFSKVVDGVKDHPRWTVGLCLGGVAALWLTIGAITACQEWRLRRV